MFCVQVEGFDESVTDEYLNLFLVSQGLDAEVVVVSIEMRATVAIVEFEKSACMLKNVKKRFSSCFFAQMLKHQD